MSLNDNPWVERHVAAETDFQFDPHGRNARRVAEALVANEYRGAPDPVPCECEEGALAYYRATIGAMQCPKCRSLYDSWGDEIHLTFGVGAEREENR